MTRFAVVCALALPFAALPASSQADQPPEPKQAEPAAKPVPKPVFELTDKYPTVGKATTIVLPERVKTITIVYAPDAPAVSTTETLDPQGTTNVLWRPKRAGVAKITAGEMTRAVSVKFDGASGMGLFILIFAATVLFGGAVLSLRTLLQAPHQHDPADVM